MAHHAAYSKGDVHVANERTIAAGLTVGLLIGLSIASATISFLIW